jgi:hypothetical protein
MGLHDDVSLFQPRDWTWREGTCGQCSRPTNFVFVASCTRTAKYSNSRQHLGICSACQGMNIIREVGPNYPAPMPGVDIVGLDAEVRAAWTEARASLSAGAPTASENMCPRILIHIAAGIEGAPEKMTFEQEWISAASGTAGMRKWVGNPRERNTPHELRRSRWNAPAHARVHATAPAGLRDEGRLEELRQRRNPVARENGAVTPVSAA